MSKKPVDSLQISSNLWIDCTAGAAVGLVVLRFMGAANILYASFSFFLATRSVRPMPLIKLLVVANVCWSLVCVGLAVEFADTVTLFGLGHVITEAIFVGGLTAQEWKWRAQLLQRSH